METVQAYYDGSVFVPIEPVSIRINQPVVVTVLDDVRENLTKKTLLSLAGSLSEEGYNDFKRALKDTEEVDVDGW